MGDATFKTEMPGNVTRGGGYLRLIKSHQDIVLTAEEITQVVERIASGRLKASLKTHRQHVKHVQAIVEEKANAVLCPKCQGDMVRRVVKRGENVGNEFWGCSAFPKCRGMLSLQPE